MLLFAISFAFMPVLQAGEMNKSIKLEEVILTLPFEELIISDDGILVNYDGDLLAVHSLERKGELWTVRAQGWFKCYNGHMRACPQCGGCGALDCPWYCDGYCCRYCR